MVYRAWKDFGDQTVLVDVTEDGDGLVLTRSITLFTKNGVGYRRIDETHTQRVFEAGVINAALSSCGFRVQSDTRYGQYPLAARRMAFIARVPQ